MNQNILESHTAIYNAIEHFCNCRLYVYNLLNTDISFLSDLHWLPVRYRISLKIATVAFRVLQFQQASYIVYMSPLIPKYVPARALHSLSSFSICVPPRKTTMATFKSLASVASHVCNALLNHLSSIRTLPAFRRALKHQLFLLAYPDSIAKSGEIKPAENTWW